MTVFFSCPRPKSMGILLGDEPQQFPTRGVDRAVSAA
jgi:hypothetical protein